MDMLRATLMILLFSMAVPAFAQPGRHPNTGAATTHPGGAAGQHLTPQQHQQQQRMMQQQFEQEMWQWESE
jgi:hypothetical protein